MGNARFLVGALAILGVASQATAENVCIGYVTFHPDKPAWKQACLDWLAENESTAPSPFGFTQGAASTQQNSAASGLSFSVGSALHVSADDLGLAAENQPEVFIAIDPTAPSEGAFVLSNQSPLATKDGIRGAYWGLDPQTLQLKWTPRKIGEQGQTFLPAARGDPWVAYSEQGTLFISYLLEPMELDPVAFPDITVSTRPTIIAKSENGGQTFEYVEALGGTSEMPQTDRGSMATGPGPSGSGGSLWVTQNDNGSLGPIAVRGAELDASGNPIACAPPKHFCTEKNVADPAEVEGAYRPGHIAVGPSGEVVVSFFRTIGTQGPTEVFAVLDPDGLGPAEFPDADELCPLPGETPPPGCIEPLMESNVGMAEAVRPHFANVITPLANLAWHRASGRLYMVTTTEEVQNSDETEVVILWAEVEDLKNPPPGGAWTDVDAPLVVNDDDEPGVRSQFFPHVAVDQTTGLVAVAWYDPRNDDGSGGTNDQRDTTANTESEVFLRVGVPTPTGIDFAPSFAVSEGSSDGSTGESFDDYIGVDFHDGIAWVSWADNSNSAGDNPADEGCAVGPDSMNPRPCIDAYAAMVEVMPEPGAVGQRLAAGGALLLLAARRRPSESAGAGG